MDRERNGALDHQTLERYDREQALLHQLDRLAPSRRAHWPKSDQRSSSRLLEHDGGAAERPPRDRPNVPHAD